MGGAPGPLGNKSRSAAFSAMDFHWTVSLSPSHSCLSLAGRPSLHLERRGQASAPEFVAGVLMACLHFPLASFGRRHPPQRPPGAQAAAASVPSSTTPALSRIHSGGRRLTASPSGRLSGALPCDVTERGGGLWLAAQDVLFPDWLMKTSVRTRRSFSARGVWSPRRV